MILIFVVPPSVFIFTLLQNPVFNIHTAPNLNECFCKRNTIQSNYNLRSSDTDLCLPKPTSEFLEKTFRYSGAMQWNHLSEDLKNSETLSSFKRKIRQA